jgi:O-antigen/teichoic acid export membrane protein
MIWSIPIGWMNSLTQYVLVAVDLQRRITGAFVVAVAFNIGSNLLFIPSYSFVAAAITTIFSEGVLFIAFAVLLQSALGKLPWAGVLWRPLAATVAMLIATLALQGMGALLALAAGCGVYLIVLLGLKPLSDEELELLAPILPRTVRYALRLR